VSERGEAEELGVQGERIALRRQQVLVEEQLRPVVQPDERFLSAQASRSAYAGGAHQTRKIGKLGGEGITSPAITAVATHGHTVVCPPGPLNWNTWSSRMGISASVWRDRNANTHTHTPLSDAGHGLVLVVG
jgi:hypothetical protein